MDHQLQPLPRRHSSESNSQPKSLCHCLCFMSKLALQTFVSYQPTSCSSNRQTQPTVAWLHVCYPLNGWRRNNTGPMALRPVLAEWVMLENVHEHSAQKKRLQEYFMLEMSSVLWYDLVDWAHRCCADTLDTLPCSLLQVPAQRHHPGLPRPNL